MWVTHKTCLLDYMNIEIIHRIKYANLTKNHMCAQLVITFSCTKPVTTCDVSVL